MIDLEVMMRSIVELETKSIREDDENLILDEILKKGMEMCNCDAGTLYMEEPNHRYLGFRVVRNNSMNYYRSYNEESLFNAIPLQNYQNYAAAIAYVQKKIINIADVYDKDCGYDLRGPMEYDARNHYHTQSMFIVPMEEESGQVVGCLQLINALSPDGKIIPFDDRDELAIRYFTIQCARTIKRIKEKQLLAEKMDLQEAGNGYDTYFQLDHLIDDYLKDNYELCFLGEYPLLGQVINGYLKEAKARSKKTARSIADATGLAETTISKFRNGNRRPSKDQALILAFELDLTYDQTKELLMLSGGYELTKHSRRDLIFECMLKHNDMLPQSHKKNVCAINEILSEYGEEILEG